MVSPRFMWWFGNIIYDPLSHVKVDQNIINIYPSEISRHNQVSIFANHASKMANQPTDPY